MKILFLGETYRADGQTWINGIESVSGDKIDTLEIASSKTRLGRLFEAISFFILLLKTRKKKRYDLVLAERATSYGFFSLFINSSRRVVAQQGITDAFPETGFAGFYKRRIQNMVYRRVDLIHAWGSVMVEAMLNSGVSPAKILVKPKGIDLEKFIYSPPKSIPVNSGIVTRSLSDVYRHEVILEAISILKKQEFYFFCNWVGDGPLFQNLLQMANDLDITDRVKFHGRIPNHLLPNLLQENPLYISMPITEGVSSSLFEAMASGCLPLVSDLRANRQFINTGKNGRLIPTDNPQALAEAIKQAIQEYQEYQTGIEENRKWIENNANLGQNMRYFYDRYLQLLFTH